MPRPTQISINLDALAANAQLARTMAGQRRIMAAVKANAYGHGMTLCAKTLEPLVDAFAVAFCEEAAQLRHAEIRKPILVLEGAFEPTDIIELASLDSWMVIHSRHQMSMLTEALEAGVVETPEVVWLKVDTGMHRLGLSPEEVPTLTHALTALGVNDVCLMSHLAHAEAPNVPLTQRQIQRWTEASQGFAGSLSLKNSAALATLGNATEHPGAVEWLRPGYMLYGGAIDTQTLGDATVASENGALATRPVMTFTSQVMAIRSIDSGETVGYGGRWTAQRKSRVATIPVGYGDGYPRTAENGTPVIVEGLRCPLVGRVSMDMITVDVTDCPAAQINSPVELWGEQLCVDEVAQCAQTIGYELLTRLPERAPRIIKSLTTAVGDA